MPELFVLKPVYIASDNIISSLGFSTSENAETILKGQTGIKLHHDTGISPVPFWASVIDHNEVNNRFSKYADPDLYTGFEKLVICSVKEALANVNIDISKENSLMIISSTKGNIDILNKNNRFHHDTERAYLWHTANLMKAFFNLHQTPVVLSNACISGVLAVIIGSRLIRSRQYEHVIVTGADLVTEFVLSGFNSFKSLCDGPCRPFDKDRTGLSLGEAAGTIILTSERSVAGQSAPIVAKGFSSNDANHISGPSRTGEGLYIAITKTIADDSTIDYISAHGTATPYNDEMESIALTRAGLENVPVNSLKGYWGHTLGAAGLIEIAAGLYSMRNNVLFKTLGFSNAGTSHPVRVIEKNTKCPVNRFLKIASGFGGSNAALMIMK